MSESLTSGTTGYTCPDCGAHVVSGSHSCTSNRAYLRYPYQEIDSFKRIAEALEDIAKSLRAIQVAIEYVPGENVTEQIQRRPGRIEFSDDTVDITQRGNLTTDATS